jgi:hypothetical protein
MPRDLRITYEVTAGIRPDATSLFMSESLDVAIEWATEHFRATQDIRLLIRKEIFDGEHRRFRRIIVWRARTLGEAQPYVASAKLAIDPRLTRFSAITGRTLIEDRKSYAYHLGRAR